MSALMKYPGFLSKAVTLSYDDGVAADKRLAEIMLNYGIAGTFNVGTLPEESGGKKLSKCEARELYSKKGIELAIHGARHLTWTEVEPSVAMRDIMANREDLEKSFSKIVNGCAYPNGAYNDTVVDILKNAGIKYARTTVSTEDFKLPVDWLRLPTTCHHNNPRLFELVDKFLAIENQPYFWRNKPRLFYLWGHSYEFDRDDNWSLIEEFCQKIGGKNDIWYATNGEIYDYTEAFKRLVFSVDLSYVYNPSAIDVYVNVLGEELIVPAGKTVEIKKI